MLVAFFVGQQFLNMSSAGAKPTDRLIVEFVQAVEQDRAAKVVYNAGDYRCRAHTICHRRAPPRRCVQRLPGAQRAYGHAETPRRARRSAAHRRHQQGHAGRGRTSRPPITARSATSWRRIPACRTMALPTRSGAARHAALHHHRFICLFFNQMQKANSSQMSRGQDEEVHRGAPDVKFDVAGVDGPSRR
ncbi:MAG: hypothetical protein ACLT98_04970 [Eggerthellaceae bacterium]